MDRIENRVVRTEKAVCVLEQRVDTLEEGQRAISDIALSVRELAVNMQHMVEAQKDISSRLAKLEREPAEEHKFIRRTILSCIITGVLGAIIAVVMAYILK